jgi:Tfp pilus assembly protein FimV
MKFKLSIAATAILAVSFVASYGQTSATNPPAKKHVATAKTKEPARPTVEEQIQALRHDLENQINSLKTDLATKDEQLQKAQQAAADARAAASRAEAAASVQQQAVTDNTSAVTTLQTSVTDLKGSQATLATKVTEETERSGRKSPIPAHCTTRASTSHQAASWRVKLFTAPRPPAATFPRLSVRFPTRARTPIR